MLSDVILSMNGKPMICKDLTDNLFMMFTATLLKSFSNQSEKAQKSSLTRFSSRSEKKRFEAKLKRI